MSERRRRREEEERMREEERRRRIIRERRRRQRVKRQRMMLAGGTLLLVAVLAVSAFVYKKGVEKKEKAKIEQQKAAEAAAKKEEENNTLRMTAVGDNLIHEALIKAGEEKDWNFDFLYENIKKDIKKADLASVNQETPFTDDHKSAAGYPDFATPSEIGDALAKAGFDIVTQATEHAFDQNVAGVLKTIKFWRKEYPDISLLGIHKEEDESSYKIIEKKNFKIAVMNYSTMLNENHTVKDSESYMLDTYSEKKIKAAVKAAKKESDVTIVYLHGGKDDPAPDRKLRSRVDFLAEQGVDVIICSHPHVLKGYEKFERPDGKETLVYYSLGNFVSNQSSLENLLGGMAEFTLKKDAKSGEVTIKDYSMVPVVMHYNSDFSECGVYKLSDYTEAMAEEHGIHAEKPDEEFTLSSLKSAAEDADEISLDHSFGADKQADTTVDDSGSKDKNSDSSTDGSKDKSSDSSTDGASEEQ